MQINIYILLVQKIQHSIKIPQINKMQVTVSHRYHCNQLNQLVKTLNSQSQIAKQLKIKDIQQNRKIHKSCTEIPRKHLQNRKQFNTNTQGGKCFQEHPPIVPYLFIPKYKNQTFIMPDRIFEKGKAGKRFHIKMIDTTITSFKDNESEKYHKLLHRKQKNSVIEGRKMEQLNRILDEGDGNVKATKIKHHLKTRKIFNPTKTSSQMFSVISPNLQPKDQQFFQTKKISLAKTFAPNMWRPASRNHSLNRTVNTFNFSQTASLFSSASCR